MSPQISKANRKRTLIVADVLAAAQASFQANSADLQALGCTAALKGTLVHSDQGHRARLWASASASARLKYYTFHSTSTVSSSPKARQAGFHPRTPCSLVVRLKCGYSEPLLLNLQLSKPHLSVPSFPFVLFADSVSLWPLTQAFSASASGC